MSHRFNDQSHVLAYFVEACIQRQTEPVPAPAHRINDLGFLLIAQQIRITILEQGKVTSVSNPHALNINQ